MNGSSRASSQGGVVVVPASSGNGIASSTLPQSRPSAGNDTRTTASVARKKKHVVIDDDMEPHRPKMVRVPTKAEFNPKGLEDEEDDEEEEEEEEDLMKNPAVSRTKYSDAGLPLDPDDSAAAPAHTYYAPPRAQLAAAQRREGRVTPPLPLPQPKNILKKVSAYQLPPPPQPPTLNGGINTNNSSYSSGHASSRGNSSRGNSSTQAPPLGAGPARRSMRQLSFADELGRELHEVTHAHNLQYASHYRQSAPMACCIVS